MADYGPPQGRPYVRPANHGYGSNSSQSRDAEYSMIFGAAPPGRSQTMATSSLQGIPDRAQTLSTQTANMMQRAPPLRPQHSGFGHPGSSGYQIPNGTTAPPPQSQPQPQHLPQPVFPDRRPYPPQRVDSRQAYNQYPPAQMSKPTTNRSYSQSQQPTVNSNSFRTQSLATNPRPPPFQPPGGSGYNGASANGFRHQPYANHLARTTAQGRVVPERHDERTMSMTSFARDNDFSQTMSGRVIPNRRRESAATQDSASSHARPSVDSFNSTQTLVAASPVRNGNEDGDSSRTMSMASTVGNADRSYSLSSKPSVSRPSGGSTQQALATQRQKRPLVYPALLSKVADVFRERIGLFDKEKDGLVYHNAFSGSEAVDLISYIMQTTDRNLALLLGRSLDAQKFFHDVTYAHRLRDSPSEVYQFRETLGDEGAEVDGVFTLTSECYSPTCTFDRLCYSIACPKRVDQQKRLNMKPQSGLKRQDSRTSLHEEQSDEQKLWINTVSKEVADSVSDREKKRQEVISEMCYTERDFVKDLEYLQDFWLKPLRSTNPARPSPIPEYRREKFLRTVFANCADVYAVNSKMAESLTRRQQDHPVVRNVGDIMLEFVPLFAPFIKYGANQLFGKYEFEREKQSNLAFMRFVDETERLKESRKLELNGYLTKPTTRLARYPLLLENVLKYTTDDSPDKEDIPRAIVGIREVLSRVNIESGKSENHFTLMQLSQQLSWRSGEYVDLKLTEENRQFLFKGHLKKSPTDSTADIQAFLFDNALLFCRAKTVNKREELKVYKRPIPLGLLIITQMEEVIPKLGITKRPSSSLIPGTRTNTNTVPKQDATKQQGYPITFRHLGRGGFEQTFYCTSQIQREKWIKLVNDQQNITREHENIFTKSILNEGFFVGNLKINCCVPIGKPSLKMDGILVADYVSFLQIDGGRKLVAGTDNGIYVMDRRPKDSSTKPRRALDVRSVTQVDVLEHNAILLVLTDKILYSYSMDALDADESPLAPSKRGRKISQANFFKIGVFDGQHLVCCVKTSALSATIKVFKPMEPVMDKKKKSGLSRMLAGGQDVLRPHKEFYVPTETYSVHFLRSSLCVGCARGFEIVTLDTLVTQPLLDQADTSLDFVLAKENLKPIHVERINRDFLLCYADFSFFVNRHGWRAFPEWKIDWEGNPQSFAIFQPYILAFEPNFIEIRNMDTGTLVYILTAKNVRMLHSSTREILYAYEDEMGEDVIASLDFWSHGRS
ncbi:MAG: RHO1 GDP-GTP exchange protein 2 [Chrysothrix sp. TS-e1954]|nr:MAG: RHO1 GDP-GTP exchange protein 2 [Chrysothrix sp. TS-e1954]